MAARERAELIVTGIARTGPLTQVLVGSSVTALARTSPIPLLVVKKKVLDTDARVVVASDLSDSSRAALVAGLRWFSIRRLSLFHAFDSPYRGLVDDKEGIDRRFEAAAVEQGQNFVRDVAGVDVAKFDIVTRRGDAVTGLQIMANEADIDLVIAGTHGRTGLMHALLGSVASRILNQVPCDVLVVPSRRR